MNKSRKATLKQHSIEERKKEINKIRIIKV